MVAEVLNDSAVKGEQIILWDGDLCDIHAYMRPQNCEDNAHDLLITS
jgi:hypothetical protein